MAKSGTKDGLAKQVDRCKEALEEAEENRRAGKHYLIAAV
jgi:hypothetical protein